MANQKFDASLFALKQEWRLYLAKVRQGLALDRRVQASMLACQQLSRICQYARFVLSFASFSSEIDLWPFNQELALQGRLVLPRVGKEKRLQLFQVIHVNHLKLSLRGILEPSPSECMPINLASIEIALIPGLGFDQQTKHRLGYGQGYYDRLLASTTARQQTWGIGFVEQAIEHLPYGPHDIPLSCIHLF